MFKRMGDGPASSEWWTRPLCACERVVDEERRAERERQEQERLDRDRRYRISENRKNSGIYGLLLDRTFENFDPTRDEKGRQEIAYHEVKAWTEKFSTKTRRGFILESVGYGCGKTHLALSAGIVTLSMGYSVKYLSIASWLAEQYAEFRKGGSGVGEAMKSAVNADLLIIDDFGVERIAEGDRGDWTRQQMFLMIDQRVNWGRPIIATTNLTGKQIAERIGGDMGGRIHSRLTQAAELLVMGGPDSRVL